MRRFIARLLNLVPREERRMPPLEYVWREAVDRYKREADRLGEENRRLIAGQEQMVRFFEAYVDSVTPISVYGHEVRELIAAQASAERQSDALEAQATRLRVAADQMRRIA